MPKAQRDFSWLVAMVGHYKKDIKTKNPSFKSIRNQSAKSVAYKRQR
jgi:hypothetical protein